MTEINLCNEVLKNAIGVHRSLEKIEPLNPIDAVAVQAMEELLEYRAIGTVEGYERALEISKENFRVGMEYKAKVQAFESIGTIEEFKALKEKAEPKKPVLNNPKINEFYVKEAKLCPVCNSYINNCSGDYCRDCGQKLDWSE